MVSSFFFFLIQYLTPVDLSQIRIYLPLHPFFVIRVYFFHSFLFLTRYAFHFGFSGAFSPILFLFVNISSGICRLDSIANDYLFLKTYVSWWVCNTMNEIDGEYRPWKKFTTMTCVSLLFRSSKRYSHGVFVQSSWNIGRWNKLDSYCDLVQVNIQIVATSVLRTHCHRNLN